MRQPLNPFKIFKSSRRVKIGSGLEWEEGVSTNQVEAFDEDARIEHNA